MVDVPLKSLKAEHISKLSQLLERNNVHGVKCITDVAEEIFKFDEERLRLVDIIRHKYEEGPMKNLLKVLKTSRPAFTIKDFSNVCEELGRADIVDLFINNKIPTDNLLSELGIFSRPTYKEMTWKLEEEDGPAVPNWRAVAKKFNIDEGRLKEKVRHDKTHTEEVIALINTFRVDFDLQQLKNCVMKLDRPDVTKCIDDIADEIMMSKNSLIQNDTLIEDVESFKLGTEAQRFNETSIERFAEDENHVVSANEDTDTRYLADFYNYPVPVDLKETFPIAYEILMKVKILGNENSSDTNINFNHIPKGAMNSFELIQLIDAYLLGINKDKRITLFMLGNTEAGKTSLCHALKSQKKFTQNPGRTEVLKLHKVNLSDDVFLNLYDTAGHTEYYYLSPLFLKSASIHFIVVDGSNYTSDKLYGSITTYIDLIASNECKGYLAVIFTKWDLKTIKEEKEGEKLDLKELTKTVEKYMLSRQSKMLFKGIHQVSAKDYSNVDDLRSKINNWLKEEESNGTQLFPYRTIPYSWWVFLDLLRERMVSSVKEAQIAYVENCLSAFKVNDTNQLQLDEKHQLYQIKLLLESIGKVSVDTENRSCKDEDIDNIDANIEHRIDITSTEDQEGSASKFTNDNLIENGSAEENEMSKLLDPNVEDPEDVRRKENDHQASEVLETNFDDLGEERGSKENGHGNIGNALTTQNENKERHDTNLILNTFNDYGELVFIKDLMMNKEGNVQCIFEPNYLIKVLKVIIRHDIEIVLNDSSKMKIERHRVINEILNKGLVCQCTIKDLLERRKVNKDMNLDKITEERIIEILIDFKIAQSYDCEGGHKFCPAMRKRIQSKKDDKVEKKCDENEEIKEKCGSTLFIPALIGHNVNSFNPKEYLNDEIYNNYLGVKYCYSEKIQSDTFNKVLLQLVGSGMIIRNAFTQKIEKRVVGIIAGVRGSLTISLATGEERSFDLIMMEIKPEEFSSDKQISIYIKSINYDNRYIFKAVSMIDDDIKSVFLKNEGKLKRYLVCHQCSKKKKLSYFFALEGFFIPPGQTCSIDRDQLDENDTETDWINDTGGHTPTDYTSNEEYFLPYDKKNIKLFLDNDIKGQNKMTFFEMRPKLNKGDQIWIYRDSVSTKCCRIIDNPYAHVMVYIGKNDEDHDEVVHVAKKDWRCKTLVFEIVREELNEAIKREKQDEKIFFFGHEIESLAHLMKFRDMIVKRANACVGLKFDYVPSTSNCETFANATLGMHGYTEQGENINSSVKCLEGLMRVLKLSHRPRPMDKLIYGKLKELDEEKRIYKPKCKRDDEKI